MLELLPLSLLALVAHAVEHFITVGGGDGAAEFNPQWLDNVDVDDFVTFNFTTSGHTVVQTSLTLPCVFITDDGAPGLHGFASPLSAAAGTTFTIQVTNISARNSLFVSCLHPEPTYLTAIFFACGTDTHCQNGAVGGINAVEFSSSVTDAAKTSVSRGFADVPSNGTALGSGVLSRVVTSPSLASSGPSRLSPGAFVGIAIVALLLLIGAALVLRHWMVVTRVRRAHKRTEWKRRLEKRLSQVHAAGATDGEPEPAVKPAGGAEDVPRM
ncbi:hypothetical protein EXIGLDRAFT_845215 [Exidia glandulosa HHB12029]|uniref:Cupredoxin n=1 Tax=Exidia glandulosa HHB12029 TaxID=1314781 RepID=A0A165BKM5_EXIGL|nr:hypothetical protein EXIGLDRAFT_845215 [Exidia glandulosa HHB12029]